MPRRCGVLIKVTTGPERSGRLMSHALRRLNVAHVDYPSHRTKLTHERLVGLTLEIDQVVSDIAATLVQQIDHVDITITDQGKNVT